MNMICPKDQNAMVFVKAITDQQNTCEGFFTCKQCKKSYLVVDGIIIALPKELMGQENDRLLQERIKTAGAK